MDSTELCGVLAKTRNRCKYLPFLVFVCHRWRFANVSGMMKRFGNVQIKKNALNF